LQLIYIHCKVAVSTVSEGSGDVWRWPGDFRHFPILVPYHNATTATSSIYLYYYVDSYLYENHNTCL